MITTPISSVVGYIDYIPVAEKLQVASVIGYVDYIGTSTPIHQAQDTAVSSISAYIEYIVPPIPEIKISSVVGYVEYNVIEPIQNSSVMGYVEYIDIRISPSISSLIGYVEYIGTPSPIAQTSDTAVSSIGGYVDYTIPVLPEIKVSSLYGYVDYVETWLLGGRLDVEDAFQAMDVTGNLPFTKFVLEVSDSSQILSSDNTTLSTQISFSTAFVGMMIEYGVPSLIVQDSSLSISSDTIIFIVGGILVADGLLSQTAENISLLAKADLFVENSSHSVSSEITQLTQHFLISVSSPYQLTQSDTFSILSKQSIVTQDNLLQITSGSVLLSQHQFITDLNAYQEIISENTSLLQHQILFTDNAYQLLSSDSFAIWLRLTITADNNTLSQSSDLLSLVQHHALNISSSIQEVISDNFDLAQNYLLISTDAYQSQNTESVFLVINLQVENTNYTVTSTGALDLIAHAVLDILNSEQIQYSDYLTVIYNQAEYILLGGYVTTGGTGKTLISKDIRQESFIAKEMLEQSLINRDLDKESYIKKEDGLPSHIYKNNH